MKVSVDFDLCDSNAVCCGLAPELFEIRDDGYLEILDENPPETMRSQAEDAAQCCPKGAITVD